MIDNVTISRIDLISMKAALELQLQIINTLLKNENSEELTPYQRKKKQRELQSQLAIEKRMKRILKSNKP